MLPLAHVILHAGFCSAMLRAPAGSPIALHVHLADRSGRVQVDRTYRIVRGDDQEAVLEFDSAFGTYRLDVGAPKYGCTATDYLFFITEHGRSISERLSNPPAPPPRPVLLSGTAPQSFLYVQPAFVLFDKNAVGCNKPIPQPLPSNAIVENDQDAYYVWLYSDPGTPPGSQQLALRLRTPTHQYHYVRVPVPFPIPWGGWPSSITLNVTEDMVDGLASEPVNTLLCPKMWRTSAG